MMNRQFGTISVILLYLVFSGSVISVLSKTQPEGTERAKQGDGSTAVDDGAASVDSNRDGGLHEGEDAQNSPWGYAFEEISTMMDELRENVFGVHEQSRRLPNAMHPFGLFKWITDGERVCARKVAMRFSL